MTTEERKNKFLVSQIYIDMNCNFLVQKFTCVRYAVTWKHAET
jgi:hypothetical protein